MTKYEILTTLISSVSILVAVGSLIWNIINSIKNRKLQKEIASMNGKIEKSNYVSKVVFDTIFLQFQKISKSLFENYNNAAVRLFPILEQTICMIPDKEGKIKKMLEFHGKSQNDLNELISITQVNRFMLTEAMVNKLETFENLMKQIIDGYENKMRDVSTGSLYEYVSREDERELTEKANETMKIFKDVEALFEDYIESLQIIS
ncbi:MAG: hypothetical protein J6K52_00580 [Clostridia bacterium]|nr:hypothetical protein [Clostridia bacterium]MBO5092000.1 hypothetical protein [Clostridia bacterium]MBP3494684.1 hypothetical protein [Clostridia bacterium]